MADIWNARLYLEAQERTRLISASQAYANFRSTSRFGSLDGLRCLSILAVIWFHGPGIVSHGIGSTGFLGVQQFFVISGFLITTLLLRERECSGAISLSKFYARRSLRIFPVYYTVLGVYVALIWPFRLETEMGRQFFVNLPHFLTYTSNWVNGTVGTFGFAWSLAAEEQFYCTWPWAERYLKATTAALLMLGILLFVLAWQIFGPKSSLPFEPLPAGILSSVPSAICWGVLTAHLLHSRRGYALAWRLIGYPWASGAMLLLVLGLLAAGARTLIVPVAFALLVVSSVVREDHWLAPLFQSRPVVYVGTISYGMYLMHGLFFDAFDRLERASARPYLHHGVAEFFLVLAGTIALASASYRYYESFFLGLKRHFSPARSAEIAAAQATSVSS